MPRPAECLWSLGATLCVGVALYAYRDLALAPLSMNNEIAASIVRGPWAPINAALAATALLVGPFQFLPGLQTRARLAHRMVGRVYVAACLFAASAGFVLALQSGADPIARWGLGTLEPVWFATTAYALWLATQRRISKHRRWMVRSFALTFAAATLRLLLPSHLHPVDRYRDFVWFSWPLNLLIAELFLNWPTLRRGVAARLQARGGGRLDP